LVTYLEVAATETTALQAQISNLNIQLRRLNASVLLVKALGGGWRQERSAEDNPSSGRSAGLGAAIR
jgi:outer membrane protein TolC